MEFSGISLVQHIFKTVPYEKNHLRLKRAFQQTNHLGSNSCEYACCAFQTFILQIVKGGVTGHSQDYVDRIASRYALGRGATRQILEGKEVLER